MQQIASSLVVTTEAQTTYLLKAPCFSHLLFLMSTCSAIIIVIFAILLCSRLSTKVITDIQTNMQMLQKQVQMQNQVHLNVIFKLDTIYQHAKKLIVQNYELSFFMHRNLEWPHFLMMLCRRICDSTHKEDGLRFVIVGNR